ncbi:hypothetical protein H2LOC_016335 [Methylocystis heyeri]|uniref:Peptidoglycan binding-like domain-containing protein n=2 Tax=Methylocystis heyeri TaxID=391905 RepID=A0A6B8KKJ9_9HYPH|nr:hypothetical protein H2LOC_016335 [Methylocystis heyeri]
MELKIMILQGRNLAQGLSGADVVALHSDLSRLGYAIAPAELQAAQFGPATLAAVKQAQAAGGVAATGTIDPGSVDALNALIRASTFVIRGHVRSAVSAGVSGLTVRLVDKNVGGDVALASAATDGAGGYSLSVLIGPPTLATRLKAAPDLQTQVVTTNANGAITIVAVSSVAIGAGSPLTLDVALPDDASLPSEFETLSARLGQFYAGKLKDLKENDVAQDVTYLGAKSGWDARAVAMASLADQFSTLAAPVAATTLAAPPPATLRAEFYYALFRAGAPADADALFRTPAETAAAIWTQAAAQGVIPQALVAAIPQATQTFQALRAAHVLTAPPKLGVSTLRDLVAPTLTGAGQPERFAAMLVSHGENWSALWSDVEANLGAAARQRLQLVGQLSYLTLDNAPLLAALDQAEAQSPLKQPIDLAARGYWDPSKWSPVVAKAAIPAGVPGATPQERAANYSAWLAAQVKLSFPTAALAQQVKSGAIPLAGAAGPAAAGEAADFLAAHQGEFAFGVEPVEAYIARNKLTPSKAAVSHLKRLQRVYQMTASDQALSALLSANVDSAFAIVRYDAEGFARAFADKVGGADAARAIHARAKQIHGVALNVAIRYATQRAAGALGRASDLVSPAEAAGGGQTLSGATLESLFGSLDSCGCDECESILGPAAYLVDLLHYLDQPAATGANPQSVLFARRPDLQYLPLSCENTEVALPYIDVVNETLEYFVANGLKIDGFEGFDVGDAKSAELIAAPQNVDDAAYAALQSSFFPAPLPFNRPLALLRAHMSALGVSTPDAMELLRKNDALNGATPGGADYGWNDILIERLGLSRDELRIFVDPGLSLGALFGLDAANALAKLNDMSVHDLVRRAQISYDNLVGILRTQFVNPAAALIPKLERLGAPFSTIKALHDNPASVGPMFIAALPADLDYSQYGGRSATSGQDVVDWLLGDAVYPRAMNLVTIANPGTGAIDCTGAQLKLRYANPDNAANLLSATDWLKIVRFTRLWRKMQALLGGDDAATIEQTDAILAALYPADKLPQKPGDSTADVANRALLDAGFLTAIRRAGVVFQAIGLLGLDAGAGLAPVLACVAPIGVTGAPSFYQSLFGASAQSAIDPGAQTATLSGTLFAGDVLSTSVNGAKIDHTVAAGETPAIAAAAIAAAINASAKADPASGKPIGQRFFAAAKGGAIVVAAGFTVAVPAAAPGATETLTPSIDRPTAQTLKIGGAPTVGDVVQFAIDDTPIAYTVAAGDTFVSIADALRDAVNATTVADPYYGRALNAIVAASSANGVLTLIAAGAAAPFALACSVQSSFKGAFNRWADAAKSRKGVFVDGAFAPGATLTTIINGAPVPFKVAAGASSATIATGIAAAINAATVQDPVTKLSVNALVSAAIDAADPSRVVLTQKDPAIGFSIAASATTTSYVAGRAASPFAEDGYGGVLGDPDQKLLMHEPFLCAACNLTGAEFAQIVQASGFDLSTPLDLPSVSALYRNGWLAHALGVSVLEFLRLKQCSGLDPFAPLDPGAAPGVAAALIRFIRLTQAIGSAGLDPVQALYLVWNEDISGALAPKPSDVAALALKLRKDFAAVEATFARKDDPDGSIAQTLMAQVYGASDTAFFFSLVGGSYRTSAPFANPAPVLSQSAIAASGGRLSYDDQNKLLIATGYLDSATAAAIKAALAVNTADNADKTAPGAGVTLTPHAMTNVAAGSALLLDTGAQAELVVVTSTTATTFTADLLLPHDGTAAPFAIVDDPSLTAAVDALALANEQVVAPFFAQYPELRPLYDGFISSGAPLAQRFSDLLASFLPTLKSARKRQQAMTDISAAVGRDAAFASALLQTPEILHASRDPASPAIDDLIGAEAGGLSGRFHLDGDPASAKPLGVDVVGPIHFAQIAAFSGAPVAGAIVTTTINGVGVTYALTVADTDLATLAGNVARSVNAATAIDAKTGSPIGGLVLARAAGPAIVLTSRYPADPKKVLTLDCGSSSAGLFYSPAQGPLSPAIAAQMPADVAGALPAGSGGGPLAVSLAGYIVAPQDGAYNISVVADAGAHAVVTLGGAVAPLVFGPGAASNAPVQLSAGALTPIMLQATGVRNTLTLSWRSPSGTGWQPVPAQYLFAQARLDDLRDSYVRFLKAVSLASGLSLDAKEIAWLAFDPLRAVATSCKEKTVAGPTTLHPVSMAGIRVGTRLRLDVGAAQEIVEVTAVTAASFTAQTIKPHDGSAVAFSIVSTSSPDIGLGWLNALPGAPYADAPGAAYPGGADGPRLRETAQAVLDFARLKKALSPGDDRLLQTLAAPGAIVPNGRSAIANLTGWRPAALNALLLRYTGSTSLDSLRRIEVFARVFDALVIVGACGVSAGALLGALTNAPTPAGVAALQSALRARYATADWLGVVKPINDALRVAQRDALVAYILQGFKSKGPPYDGLDTADKLFEFFLMDVENQPAVLTSRIRLALLSAQLFIERILRGLEPQITPSDIDPQQWSWMKRYRVWQANREVFLWPENWLYPELRDDQSPIFKKTLSALLQGDMTEDAAAEAYLGYLSELEQIAKLEPCGIWYAPASDGSAGGGASDEIAYVVARTAGAHRKHYFRRLQGGSWTPWEEVKIDCEDMPLTPIVWKGRLFLFWLRIHKNQAVAPAIGDPANTGNISGWDMGAVNAYTGSSAGKATPLAVQAVLCWSEFYNGKWQDMKTSDVNHPATLNIDASAADREFELLRNRIRIVVAPVPSSVPSDALALAILPPGDGTKPVEPFGPGFILHNTHSLPTLSADLPRTKTRTGRTNPPLPLRTLGPSRKYVGDRTAGTFTMTRYDTLSSVSANHADVTLPILGFPASPRFTEPQIGPGDGTDWPFFYEDRRSQFYVAITKSFSPYHVWPGFGSLATAPPLAEIPHIPPLAVATAVPAGVGPDPGPLADPSAGATPGGPWSFAGARNVVALSNQGSFSFQGRVIGLGGGAPGVIANISIQRAGG